MLFNKQKNIVNGFQVIKDEWISSKTGMFQPRLCDNEYDCRTYPFGSAVQKTFNAAPQRKSSGWAKNVKDIYKWTNSPCLHALAGRVTAAKICVNNYECYHCAYDQMLDDEEMAFLDEKAASMKASGYLVADE